MGYPPFLAESTTNDGLPYSQNDGHLICSNTNNIRSGCEFALKSQELFPCQASAT